MNNTAQKEGFTLLRSIKVNRFGFTLLRSIKVNRFGFTLVELLVVIAIIAILSVVGVVVFSNVQTNVRISAAKATLKNLQQAMIRYRITNGEMPAPGDHWTCGADEVGNEAALRIVLNDLASSNQEDPILLR